MTRRLVVVAWLLAGCGAPQFYEARREREVEPVEVRLVRITAEGLVPDEPIRLTQNEGGVAFLNDTRDRVVSVLIPGRALPALRCAYTQGFSSDEGATFTSTPLSPGASASLCVHDAGTIAFEVHGVSDAPLHGTLDVAPVASASGGAP
jgi:hypothetical protein